MNLEKMIQAKKPQTIKDVIPLTNGIFSHMNYTFRSEVTKANLDLMFQANYSKRVISPVIEVIQTTKFSKLTNEELTTLAAVILEMYKEKWDKLKDIYDIEYDPIHNFLDEWEDTSEGSEAVDAETHGTKTDAYGHVISTEFERRDGENSTETLERDFDNTRTDNLTELETRALSNSNTRTDNLTEQKTYGKTDTRTDNLLETDTYGKTSTRTDNLASTEDVATNGTGSGNEDNSVYGFNSSAAVNSDSSSTSDTSSETVDRDTTNTGTSALADSGSDSKANTGTSAHAESGSDSVHNTGTQTTQGTDTGTLTTANTGTQAEIGNDDYEKKLAATRDRLDEGSTTNSGSDTQTTSGTEERTTSTSRDRSGRHFGNIGNLTSQKQILEEINLWKWNYMKEILDDVKEFCTLPIYMDCT